VQRAIDLHKSEQNLGRHRADNNTVLFHQSAASLRSRPKTDES
jgi:GST-like protein